MEAKLARVARVGRINDRSTINDSRNGNAPRIYGGIIITSGMAVGNYFSKRFRERVAGKSNWAREWNKIRDRVNRNMARKISNSSMKDALEESSPYNAGRSLAEMYNANRVNPDRSSFLSFVNKWAKKHGEAAKLVQGEITDGFRSTFKGGTRHNNPNDDSSLSSLSHDLDTLDVSRMSEKFHGRAALSEFDVTETDIYDKNQAVLGDLVELNVIDPNKPDTEFTISFKSDQPLLCCNAEGSQLEIIGGDQTLEIPTNDTNKYLVELGEIRTISYFTDKHHLAGSKDQAKGVEYEHEFGEEGGRRPVAVYNTRSCKIMIVGGDYTVEEEGIAN